MPTYRYRFTGDAPKEWARGVLKPGDEIESDEPLYNGELEHIGGAEPPPWKADVAAPEVTEAAAEAAADLGVAPEAVQGSGKEGRVTKKDVQAAAAAEPGAQPETSPKEG